MVKKLLYRLEARYGRYAGIRNLMTCIVAGIAAVYVGDLLLGAMSGQSLYSWLRFDRALILKGQFWRLLTFILVPSSGGIFLIFSLLFYKFLGDQLQTCWGNLRFNIFYFTGVLGAIVAGFITGVASSYYLNMSLFLAVAILAPERQVNIYGILPIRMKWLALIDVVMLALPIIYASPSQYLEILLPIVLSLGNVLLFFYDHFIDLFKDFKRRREWRKAWKR